MQVKLPDGLYPFIDQRSPLSELAMIEVPTDLEQLLRSQAAANGSMSIIRGIPVELRCQSEQFPDATFLVYWPHEDDRLHMLARRKSTKGTSRNLVVVTARRGPARGCSKTYAKARGLYGRA